MGLALYETDNRLKALQEAHQVARAISDNHIQ